MDINTKTQINSLSGSVPLILIEIDHPDLAEPLRFVQNSENIVSNGETYTACGFDLTIPSQPEGGYPTASISVSNIDAIAMPYLEETNGGIGSTLRIIQVLASDPNTLQYDVILYLSEIHVSRKTMTATLSYEALLGLPLIRKRYTPQNAPGIFSNV